MTQFDLFRLIYGVIDSEWKKTRSEDLVEFLSDANPFVWSDIGSADPYIFLEFCKYVKQEEIPLNESYKIACNYVKFLSKHYELYKAVPGAFFKTSEEKWLEYVKIL